MVGEIIDGQVDRFAYFQLDDVLGQEIGLQRIGMVKVYFTALVGG